MSNPDDWNNRCPYYDTHYRGRNPKWLGNLILGCDSGDKNQPFIDLTCFVDSVAGVVVGTAVTGTDATVVLGVTLVATETSAVGMPAGASGAGAAGICTGIMSPLGIRTITCSMYCCVPVGPTLGTTGAPTTALTTEGALVVVTDAERLQQTEP